MKQMRDAREQTLITLHDGKHLDISGRPLDYLQQVVSDIRQFLLK